MHKFDETIDYYSWLGVSSDASPKEITKAYKALVAKYHPDKHQGNELEDLAKEKLEQLNAAYTVLSDSKIKLSYDTIRRTLNSRETYRSSCHCAPSAPPPDSGNIIKTIFKWISLVFLVFIAYKIRSPRGSIIIAAIMAIIWLVPKIKNFLKK